MDRNIIDLQGYLADRSSHFAVWGGEGVRARFALPLWRAAALAKVRRVGLLKRPRANNEVTLGPTLVSDERAAALDRSVQVAETAPVFVLDLGSDEARIDYDGTVVPAEVQPPLAIESKMVIVIALGSKGAHDWFMVLDTPGEPLGPLDSLTREQLLFFAGECAGLLEQQVVAEGTDD